ncbi:hypothetical protein [Quadrisphaera sp. DSM 44207]|uniref:hypothetical protein n=1 Tax=Quadrisphaera sp. DSM 44207 TaxID=1881057 RepID=UPI000885F885|nr:hypothetical protein [Quadrisphaera sp. DSM 44207]SDQ46752.1 Type II secretory pathway, pseudopilin PulG [Quadrisphaera sp. DSM 44207]
MTPRGSTAPRRAQAADGGEAGLTLVELLTTTVLLGIVGTMVLSMVVGTTRSLQASDRRVEATTTTQVALQTITRAVRSAAEVPQPDPAAALPGVVPTSSTSLLVRSWTAAGPAPVLVELSVDPAGALVETRTPATASAGTWSFSGTASTRTVLSGVVNPAGTPVFTYYDADGQELLPEPDTTGVASVGVRLLVQTDPLGRVAPAEVSTRVHLPNEKVTAP